jgi:hypothetical protein
MDKIIKRKRISRRNRTIKKSKQTKQSKTMKILGKRKRTKTKTKSQQKTATSSRKKRKPNEKWRSHDKKIQEDYKSAEIIPEDSVRYIIYSHGTNIKYFKNVFKSDDKTKEAPNSVKVPKNTTVRFYVKNGKILLGSIETLKGICRGNIVAKETKKQGETTENMIFSGDDIQSKKVYIGENTMGLWVCVNGVKLEKLHSFLPNDQINFLTIFKEVEQYHMQHFPNVKKKTIDVHTCRPYDLIQVKQHVEKMDPDKELSTMFNKMKLDTQSLDKELITMFKKMKINN